MLATVGGNGMSHKQDTIRQAEHKAKKDLGVDSEKVRELEEEAREERKILSLNAWHLARFIMEHNKCDSYKINVPEGVNIGEFMDMAEDYPFLPREKKVLFLNQYALLEQASCEVTARTLYATRIYGKHPFAFLKTSVGMHLLVLSAVSIVFIILLARHSEWFPFYAAGLGACVYILRVTQEKFKSREFDPAWIPSHYIRVLLGTLAGGSIVFFPELQDFLTGQQADVLAELEKIHQAALGNIDAADKQGMQQAAYQGAKQAITAAGLEHKFGVGSGLLAFILGYAVDIYYSILDRIGGKITG